MNVISSYLDTMFSSYPSSPRLLEAKNELHTMMEDAYTGYLAAGLSENEAVGRVITEFGNLDELAPVLGITSDITRETPAAAGAAAPTPPALPPVTQEEATAYADARRSTEPRLALASAIFVVSPAPLIALSALGSSGTTALDENTGSLVGIIALLLLIATGVMIAINRNQHLAPHSRITEGAFTRSPGVELWARSLAAETAPKRTLRLQIAIALWILAVVPNLLMSFIPGSDSPASDARWGASVALTLLMVAAGLLVFLPANWATAVSAALAEGGRAPGAADDGRSIIGVIAAFYWPLLTAIFLAWGFIGDAWDRCWIVWPIGGVLFGAIAAGFGAWEGFRKERR